MRMQVDRWAGLSSGFVVSLICVKIQGVYFGSTHIQAIPETYLGRDACTLGNVRRKRTTSCQPGYNCLIDNSHDAAPGWELEVCSCNCVEGDSMIASREDHSRLGLDQTLSFIVDDLAEVHSLGSTTYLYNTSTGLKTL